MKITAYRVVVTVLLSRIVWDFSRAAATLCLFVYWWFPWTLTAEHWIVNISFFSARSPQAPGVLWVRKTPGRGVAGNESPISVSCWAREASLWCLFVYWLICLLVIPLNIDRWALNSEHFILCSKASAGTLRFMNAQRRRLAAKPPGGDVAGNEGTSSFGSAQDEWV